MVSKDFANLFAEVVRPHREEIKMSQELLAEKADLSLKIISLAEWGERTPTLTVAESIALGLSVPLWRLVKDAEDLKREQKMARRKRNVPSTSVR